MRVYILKKLNVVILLLLFVLATLNHIKLVAPAQSIQLDSLVLTSETNQAKYNIREPVILQGNFYEGVQPLTDSLIAIQVNDPVGARVAYRTLPIGNPQEFWQLNVTDFSITDQNSNPIAAAKIGATIRLSITLRNRVLNPLNNIIVVYSLYDKTLIPIKSRFWQVSIPVNQSLTVYDTSVVIPAWASSGKALISINAFNRFPIDGGYPLIPEELVQIYIARNEELPSYAPEALLSYETQPGEYQMYFRVSPDRYAKIGTYSAYITGRTTPLNATSFKMTSESTTFMTESNPSPPQAAFTYYPPNLYENMTGTFDASSSSAEGFNDTIIRYEWFFDDPSNPEQIINEGTYTNPPTPMASHIFEFEGTYLVSLNVTDNEGLWSYTVKPITILAEYGPTADFTWTPLQPIVNATTTFNATSTELGWSLQLGDYSPILTYSWNFSDGTPIANTTSPTLNHLFPQPGNFSVNLTVTDSVGKVDSINYIVEVLNITRYLYDVNGDGYVGIDDIVLTAENFGNTPGQPEWNPAADVNGDSYGGIDDIVSVAEHFGESEPWP